MPFKLTLNSLFNFLSKNSYLPQLQRETKQIYILLRQSHFEFAIFLRLLDEGDLLQILVYLPLRLKDETITDVSRLLHKINHDVDVPGFGLNEPSQLVFYRVVLPCPQKMCNSELLIKYLKTGPKVAATFFNVISHVASGTASFNDILKKEH